MPRHIDINLDHSYPSYTDDEHEEEFDSQADGVADHRHPRFHYPIHHVQDVAPDESASTQPTQSHSAEGLRLGTRQHHLQPDHPGNPARQSYTGLGGFRHVPAVQMNAYPPEDVHYDNPRAFYGGGGGGRGYQQNHPPQGYMANQYGQQMVPGNYYASGAAYFRDPRQGPPFETGMMPYYPGGGGAYFSQGLPPYALPGQVQQYIYPSAPAAPAPPPPPAETPAPAPKPASPEPEKIDPEKEKMKMELEMFKQMQAKKQEEEEKKKRAEEIQAEANAAFERKLAEMRIAQEEASKVAEKARLEIEKAKADAERAAREKMEAERKAEDERRKEHEEAMKRAERDARDKIEAEHKAAEEVRKAAAAAAEAAEAAALRKVEAAMKAEAEAKAKAEAKVKEEEAWRKMLEEKAQVKAENEARAKLAEEQKKAEEAAAAEEAAKQAQEAFRLQVLEEAKIAAEKEATEKEKAPIHFKDALGRKFKFPFNICQKWSGMDELIKSAFQHLDVNGVGPQVQAGEYDLLGPNGDIILPSVWETTIEPDWSITMVMWRKEKPPPPQHKSPFPQPGVSFMSGAGGPRPSPLDDADMLRAYHSALNRGRTPAGAGLGAAFDRFGPQAAMFDGRAAGGPVPVPPPPPGAVHTGGGVWSGMPQPRRGHPNIVTVPDPQDGKGGRRPAPKQPNPLLAFLAGRPQKKGGGGKPKKK